MKISKQTLNSRNNAKEHSKNKQHKQGQQFCVNETQSLANRRFLHFVKESNKSKEKMSSITTSSHNICSTMLFGCNTPRSMQQVSIGSHAKTQQLNLALQSIQKTNSRLNRGDLDSLGETDKTRKHCQSESKIKSKLRLKGKQRPTYSLSNVSTLLIENTTDYNTEEEAITQSFNQMMKLQKLKGDIKLNDQKKKYGINKTYEPKKHFPEGHFYRKEPNTIKYIPCYTYHKEDLFYKKKYNDNNLNCNLNMNDQCYSDRSYTNDINYYQCLTTNPQVKTKSKIVSSHLDYYPSAIKKSSNYYSNNNTQLSTNRATNANLSTITYNYPKSAIPKTRANSQIKGKNKSKLQRKIILEQLASIHLEIFKQNEELKRIITEDSSKQKPMRKIPKKKLEISNIRKELKLDSLDSRINENKILVSNAERVAKNLDERSKGFLVRIVKEMMYTDEVLNRQYYEDSYYDQKIQCIKEKKEIQKVVDQMMALKKELKDQKAIVPENEKEKMVKMIRKTSRNEWVDIDKLKYTLQKYKVMTKVNPLINHSHRKMNKKH